MATRISHGHSFCFTHATLKMCSIEQIPRAAAYGAEQHSCGNRANRLSIYRPPYPSAEKYRLFFSLVSGSTGPQFDPYSPGCLYEGLWPMRSIRPERVTQAEVRHHRRRQVLRAPRGGRRHGGGARVSRRRKAERRSQASADEAVHRASVEQDGDTPGTLRGVEEARQARLKSRIRAGPHRKRWGASQRSQLGLHLPGQLIDGVVNPVGGQPCGKVVIFDEG